MKLGYLLTALASLCLATPTLAAELQCNPLGDLSYEGLAPATFVVKADVDRLHFQRDGGEDGDCPGTDASCEMRSYLVPGNPVVVTSQNGDYACATFTGGAPNFVSTSGWLAKNELEAFPPKPAESTWTGDWRQGDEQEIKIAMNPDGQLALDGYASWGAADPQRVANGGVNTGSIAGTVMIDKPDMVAFSLDVNGKPVAGANLKDDSTCAVKMWKMPPYLVVADNLACGGMNVTFTGVYAK
ncbi:MAG TPA: hypothetical protein VGM83_22625 [Devosiaceae bacterium]|jgi:hypothetical protein